MGDLGIEAQLHAIGIVEGQDPPDGRLDDRRMLDTSWGWDCADYV